MKTVLTALDGLSEDLKTEYEAKDGKFYLKLEGDVPSHTAALAAANARIIEFRNKNIELMKETEELRPLKLQFEGIDADAAKDALEKVKALGKKGIKDIDDFEARVKMTVDEVVKPLREQLQTSANETAAERRRADEFLLHSTIGDTFVKAGGKPNAVDFIVGLAKDNFEVKDGKVSTKAGKFSTEKPGDALSVTEWLTTSIQKDHDYVFEPSKGGGAPIVKPGTRIAGAKTGQTILKDPSPQELGANSADIAAGKVRVEYSTH